MRHPRQGTEKEGFSERASILIDEKGKVVFARTYPVAEQPDIEEILETLARRKP